MYVFISTACFLLFLFTSLISRVGYILHAWNSSLWWNYVDGSFGVFRKRPFKDLCSIHSCFYLRVISSRESVTVCLRALKCFASQPSLSSLRHKQTRSSSSCQNPSHRSFRCLSWHYSLLCDRLLASVEWGKCQGYVFITLTVARWWRSDHSAVLCKHLSGAVLCGTMHQVKEREKPIQDSEGG